MKGHWKRNCKKYLNEKAQWKHGDAPSIYMRKCGQPVRARAASASGVPDAGADNGLGADPGRGRGRGRECCLSTGAIRIEAQADR